MVLSVVFLTAVSGPDDRHVTDPKSIASVPNPDAGPVSIDDLFFTRDVSGPAWSPDGKDIVLTTNFTGRNNLWKVSSSGGWPIQLSQSDDRQSAAVWSPDGKWIVYQQDHGGGEVYDIFAIPSSGGEAVNLTNTEEISETSPEFSPDGKNLVIAWKPRTSPKPDLALLDWQTRKVRNLTNERAQDRVWRFVAWTHDGHTIYANRAYINGADGDVYRIDVNTGKLENLTPHQGSTLYAASSLSADGRMLLITTDKTGFNNVGLLDVASKAVTLVTSTQWDAAAGNFAPSGSSFTYLINQDGQTRIYLGTPGSTAQDPLPFPEGLTYFDGNPTPFSPAGDRLLVGHQSAQTPPDLWVYDLRSRKPIQLTHSAIADLNPSKLPAAQVVHYKSFDGKMISAFVWMPFNLKRDGTTPGVVLPHGGPTGQIVDYFNRDAAALASRGYVCIAPNVRGSTGYGAAFQEANKKDLGGGDLQDEVYAAHFLVDTGYVDPKKIGITGGSYGGYMTLMAIGKTPAIWGRRG